MDIQKQLAMAAVAKAHKRNGTTPPPLQSEAAKKKSPIVTGADPKQSSKAKNAAAAAIAARLGGGGGGPRAPPPATATASNGGNAAAAEKYKKMLKMGVPAGAVRGKMVAEGLPQAVINDVLSDSGGASAPGGATRPKAPSPPAQKTGGVSQLTANEEKIATQYRKMVKLGLPDGAIRHKMNADGVSQKIQDSVIAGEKPAGSAPTTPAAASTAVASKSQSRPQAPPPPPTKKSGGISSLSPKEEKIATQYRKMVKMGLPDGAVRHKMMADGVAQNIQDSVIAGETPASKPTAGGPASQPTAASSAPKQVKKVALSSAPAETAKPPPKKVSHAPVPVAAPKKAIAPPVRAPVPAPKKASSEVVSTPRKTPPAPLPVPIPVSAPAAAPTSSLSPDEEEVAEHYRSLVRGGRTMEDVESEMESDGAPPIIQDAVRATFAAPPAPAPAPVAKPPAQVTPAAVKTRSTPAPAPEKVQSEEIGMVRSSPQESSQKNEAAENSTDTWQDNPVGVEAAAPMPPSEAPKKKKNKSKKKKKPKGPYKTERGTVINPDGTEQHCSCTIM